VLAVPGVQRVGRPERSVQLYARTQTNSQFPVDSRNGGHVSFEGLRQSVVTRTDFSNWKSVSSPDGFGLAPVAQRRKRGCSVTSFRLKLMGMDCRCRPAETAYSTDQLPIEPRQGRPTEGALEPAWTSHDVKPKETR
jgi:hypothetical protein